jgi:hypothetical protein
MPTRSVTLYFGPTALWELPDRTCRSSKVFLLSIGGRSLVSPRAPTVADAAGA